MFTLLIACRASNDAGPLRSDAPPDTGPVETTTPYLVPSTTEAPPYDVAWAQAGLEAAIAIAPGLEAATPIALYRSLRALGDDQCPASYPYDGYEYWYAQCTSDLGATFTGYSWEYTYGGGNYLWEAIYMASSIVAPDGFTLASTGVFGHEITSVPGGLQTHDVQLSGTFTWDGAGAEGTWVGLGLVPTLTTTRTLDDDERSLTIDGGVAGIEGDPSTVEYTGVHFDTRAGCAEPVGTLSLRTEAGEWFDITFDAIDCDGCGTAANRGVEVGTACADFTPWATWQTP